jgi:NAD(P)-dependent dehydrogenase (short-subunit alcohol dehydrogenase family)
MLLTDKVVIVTGGARGIGACICRTLARHGATAIVNYAASADAAASVVAEVEAAGGRALAVAADVRDPQAVASMVQQTVDAFGRVDGLVNNAIAGQQSASFDTVKWSDYQDMLDFGCKAVFNTIQAVRPVMRDQESGGRIVNIVTELWNMAPQNWSGYCAGKGAMVGMSRSLANELGADGITVNMVAPGWMITEKVDPASEGSQNFGKSLPVGWHGSGDEIGNGCVFFISDLGSYVTGAYIPVTGGRVTQMGA